MIRLGFVWDSELTLTRGKAIKELSYFTRWDRDDRAILNGKNHGVSGNGKKTHQRAHNFRWGECHDHGILPIKLGDETDENIKHMGFDHHVMVVFHMRI